MPVGAQPLGEIGAEFEAKRVDPDVCNRPWRVPHPGGVNAALSQRPANLEPRRSTAVENASRVSSNHSS